MDHQVEAAFEHVAFEHDVQELSVPGGVRDRQSGQRRDRRVIRLEHAERGHLDALDAVSGRPLPQVRGEGGDLGEFRHAVQSAGYRGAVVGSGPP
jgi:hypothetical protein